MKQNSKKKRKGKKIVKWIICILILLVVVVIVVKVRNAKNNKIEIPRITTTNAYRGDLQEQVSVGGIVAGEESIVLYAPADGVVDSVIPQAGDEVDAGELLLTYDLEAMDESLYQAKLQNERTQISYEVTLNGNSEGNGKLNEANTNIPVLEQQIADHEKYLENLQKELSDYQAKQSDDRILLNHQLTKKQAELMALLETLTPGTAEYEDAAQQLAAVQAQLEQLSLSQSLTQQPTDYVKELQEKIKQEQKTLGELRDYLTEMERQKTSGEASVMDSYQRRQLEIDMELTKLNYDKLLKGRENAEKGVLAPFRGVVTNVNVAHGSTVGEGTPVIVIERSDKLIVKAEATKYILDRLKVGQKVDIDIVGETYEGRVKHISKVAQTTNLAAIVVEFEVEILGNVENVFLQTEVKMVIYTNRSDNTLILPTEAVNANQDGDFVYLVQGDTVTICPVTCGITSEGLVEILSGITEADEVVLDYEGEIEDGAVVERIQ